MDASALKQIELFHGLTHRHLEALASITEDRTHEAGTRLFAEGDAGDELFMVLRGKVRISKIVEGVGEEALAILEPGAYFGEMALVSDLPRSAHATCNTPVEVGVIRREAFEQLLFLDKDLRLRAALDLRPYPVPAPRRDQRQDQGVLRHVEPLLRRGPRAPHR